MTLPTRSRVLTPVPVPVLTGSAALVLDPDLLGTTGPVLVDVAAAGGRATAWAWARTAAGLPPEAAALGSDEAGVSARLLDLLLPGDGPVTVTVPQVAHRRVLASRIDDLPQRDEVQVPRTDPGGRALLVRGGVTAWVTCVPRPHVPAGAVRLTYQMRLLTDAEGADASAPVTLTFPGDEGAGPARRGRLRRAVDRAVERLLTAVFRAPEFAVRITQAHAGDDEGPLVALHPAVFDRIGVEPGQQVVVRWGDREITAMAVADHAPHGTGPVSAAGRAAQRVNLVSPDLPGDMSPHLVARLSAPARRSLGAPAATVVTVRRRLRPVLVRNLGALVLPLAGLLLAAAALEDPNWWLVGTGTALMSVLGLAGVRIPVVRRDDAERRR